jgi:hypothetical protein
MDAVESRYRFSEDLFGFRVEGRERPPVQVLLHPLGLEACYAGEERPGSRERFGFYNFGRLLEFVAGGLLRHWRPQEGWYGVRQWAQRQTARAIARRLREHWQRLLGRADPTVLAVQRAVFAATFGDAPLAAEPELYQDRFLVHDVLHYPAAAVAVRNAWVLCRDLPLARLHHSPQARDLRALAAQMGLPVSIAVTDPEDPDPATQLARLQDWKSLFADTGHAYRSLNRTLMNLPGGVPHRQVCNLRRVHLERPLTRRLELLALVLYAGLRAERDDLGGARADHTHVFTHAPARHLVEAMRRVSAHTRNAMSSRRAGDVRLFVHFLADYPEPHAGSVVGLAERAIRWHRDRQQEQTAALRRSYGAETLTMSPPIPPPDVAELRFLDSVGAVCAEAERMQHCVASYVDLAVQGNCYLFHVNYGGEEATVEVGCEGAVRQAQGPRNQRNRAARWGKRVLSRWAAGFPPALSTYHSARRAIPLGAAPDEDIPF